MYMVTYKIHTDLGSRENNEDSVGETDNGTNFCFVLADGLGGHGGGEFASALAVKTALELFDKTSSDEFLKESFENAQANVLEEQKKSRELFDMKTTMVILTLYGNKVCWGHIGDSRLYHFKGSKLVEHTLDHSVPQMLVNTGEIKEKDIRGHEDRNILLRVIGSPWGKRSFDVSQNMQCKKFDAFLMCSDGFWELIEEKQMIKLLKKAQSVEEWLDSMVSEVMSNGKGKDMDNNSAIAVWVEE
jgi:serine/threonine protein phosphatase PrpC